MAKRKPNNKKGSDIFALLRPAKKEGAFYRSAKVGIVTALVGGIFKAIALTKTFPQPFDTMGNVILFIAFLLMLFSFLLGRF